MNRHLFSLLLFLGFAVPATARQSDELRFPGDPATDRFGTAVVGVGDVDGDGFADVAVGTPYDSTQGSNRGMVGVFSGLDGSLLLRIYGGADGDQFGWAVAPAGDVNGDGSADFLVGSPGYRNGSLAQAGRADLVSGRDGSLLESWKGEASQNFFGSALAGIGDADGDGVPDIAVGARWAGHNGFNSGSVYVFSGADGSQLLRRDGNAPNDYLGAAVAAAGDVDGDGHADFLAGAWGADPNGESSGQASLFSGRDGSLLRSWDGMAEQIRFGQTLAGLGDVNGDGVPDVAVGASFDNTAAFHAGAVRVFSGADGSLLNIFLGDNANDMLGASLAAAGDVDGDGFGDLVAGAPFNDDVDLNAGLAHVYSGQDGSVIATWRGQAFSDRLGTAVAGAGDVNGDGFADVILGAPHGNSLDPGYAWVPFSESTLALEPPADLSTGRAVFRASDGRPGARLSLHYSLNGFGMILGRKGTRLDLAPPVRRLNRRGLAKLDQSGNGRVVVRLSSKLSGATLYVQALERKGGIRRRSTAIAVDVQ